MSDHTAKQKLEILLNMSVYVAEMQLSEEGRAATYALIYSIAQEYGVELDDEMREMIEDAGIEVEEVSQEKNKPALSIIQGLKDRSDS